MAAYRRVDDLQSPAGLLPVHRDQLRAQRSVSRMGSLYLFFTLILDVVCLSFDWRSTFCAVYCVCSETNDGGCVNDQQLRDFTNQFLHIPALPAARRRDRHCSVSPESEGDCTLPESRYGSVEELQNFTFTVINPAFAGTMRGMRVIRQLVPHHRSSVKVRNDRCVG